MGGEEDRVSTTTFATVPENPEIPLKPEVRQAYKDLYSQYESAIENTTDTTLLEKLNASQLAVAAVINADNEAIRDGNTNTFNQVLTNIGIANKGLADLKAQIESVAKDVGMYAGIVSRITAVLGMVPGI